MLNNYNWNGNMTQEEKQLLLKDLCARLPYKVKINIKDDYSQKMVDDILCAYHIGGISYNLESRNLKPYLRSMSSMTKEERRESDKLIAKCIYDPDAYFFDNHNSLYDWLLSHHFDYHGLIQKGLALEAPRDMYKTE